MKFSKRLRQVLEGLFARLGLLVIPLLPRGAIVWLGRTVGRVAYRVARRERDVGAANLELAFGATHSAAARDQILRDAFVTFTLLILDLFWFSRNQERRLAEFVKFDESYRYFRDHPPCIALTAHFGNWEVMGLASAAQGSPVTVVFAELKNPVIDTLVARLRHGAGQTAAEKTGVLLFLIRTLREGRHIAVLLDQNTPPSQGGCYVDFFGSPVPMSMAVAALADKTGAPVVPAFCIRNMNGTYSPYSLPPLRREEAETREAFTQRMAAIIEGEVRKHPEQWLWMYKRWKFIPEGADAEGFPFYARPESYG